jgi:predicted DNA-binding transcriptional regulator YafY
MDFLKYSEYLDSIVNNIQSKTCVTAAALSKKLNVSKRTVYRMIDHLKLKGIKIEHCRRRKKYFIES